jgi:predicted porin
MPSVFGITGTEDLGGGLKASFNLESDVNVDTGALSGASGGKLFGRKANVNLSGSFGTLTAGKDIDQIFLQGFIDNIRNSHSSSAFLHHAFMDYVALGSNLSSVHEHQVFTQNLVRYTTPTFNGFKVAYQHSFGEVAGNSSANKGENILATWSGNGLTLAAGHKKVSSIAVATTTGGAGTTPILVGDAVDHKLTYLGATYTLGALKFAATHHKSKFTNVGFDHKTTEFGVAYTINPKLVAAVNHQHTDVGILGSGSNNDSVSLKYSLSKRTALWTLVSRSGNNILAANYAQALANADSGKKSTSTAVGVTHSF